MKGAVMAPLSFQPGLSGFAATGTLAHSGIALVGCYVGQNSWPATPDKPGLVRSPGTA